MEIVSMSMNKKMTGTQGFTLVELSIVIIIIGFLIAGIAAGTSLIKQAELNSIVTDFQGYQTSYNNFLGRYTKAPGDFDAAGTIWPACTGTPADCNGNANGVIDLGGAGAVTNEGVLAWKHLSLANMISSGIQDPLTTQATDAVYKLGTSVPLSKVGGAGYMMFFGNDGANATPGLANIPASGLWNDNRTNAVYIGKPGANLFLDVGALKAEDAFNVDKKLDDGAVSGGVFTGANTGFIRTVEGVNAVPNDCLTNANGATSANYAIGTGTATTACVVALGLN